MRKFAPLLLFAAMSAQAQVPPGLNAELPPSTIVAPAPVISSWQPKTTAIGYGVAAVVDRYSAGGAPADSVVTVGAQFIVAHHYGVNQIAFGIATEAWADYGSISRLVGIEATTINRESTNELRKISYWATYKNRPDNMYYTPPANAANVDSQAIRIESQPNTGFERGIVFAPDSLHASTREAQPVVIDFKEVPMEVMQTWVLVRYPDGYCKYYIGNGFEEIRLCGTAPTGGQRHRGAP